MVGLDQGFRAFSTTIYEESEAFTLELDVEAIANYDSFRQTYDYPVTGGNDSLGYEYSWSPAGPGAG